jgi:UDP-N-acetylmuramate-alanine ligase
LNSFNESDSVILLKTYPARELESDGKSAKDLFLSLKAINHKFFSLLEYAEDFKSAEKMIKKESINYDCILILGAGDIETLAKYILK